ncbi:MAG: elongation factor P [Acholeplasmataceae bacterium]|nr:elongation factor P [Acholeplasmataceae bacterium]
MEMISAIDLRAGHAFEYNGSVWQVLEQDFMKPGKGNAVMRVKMKDLKSGSIVQTTLNPNNKYRKCIIDKKDMLFSYVDGDSYVFMDNEDYTTIEVPAENLKWMKNFIVPGESNCVVSMCEGDILGVATKEEKVALTVSEAEPAVKGNTSQTARKKVTLETGFQVEVPLFIEEGDKVIVNVTDGSYCSRA